MPTKRISLIREHTEEVCMGRLKREILDAWLNEQVLAGNLSIEELHTIRESDDVAQWVRHMMQAVSQTGDTTPFEILAGDIVGGGHSEDIYCR
jgi:hypothetical protein